MDGIEVSQVRVEGGGSVPSEVRPPRGGAVRAGLDAWMRSTKGAFVWLLTGGGMGSILALI